MSATSCWGAGSGMGSNGVYAPAYMQHVAALTSLPCGCLPDLVAATIIYSNI